MNAMPHGLATASFYDWRRVLERRATERPAFVPVEVVADPPPPQASALELVLPDGRAVRVSPGFDVATLRRLLAVLEGEGARDEEDSHRSQKLAERRVAARRPDGGDAL
jgi:hypothetical protein